MYGPGSILLLMQQHVKLMHVNENLIDYKLFSDLIVFYEF